MADDDKPLPLLDPVPILRPTMSEFHNGDLIEFVRSIRDLLARYGAVRVDPPREWTPPSVRSSVLPSRTGAAPAASSAEPRQLPHIPDTTFSNNFAPPHNGAAAGCDLTRGDPHATHQFRLAALLRERRRIRAAHPDGDAAAKQWCTHPLEVEEAERLFWSRVWNGGAAKPVDANGVAHNTETPPLSPPRRALVSGKGPLTDLLGNRGNSLLHLIDKGDDNRPQELLNLSRSKVVLEEAFSTSRWTSDPNGLRHVSYLHGGPRKIWYMCPPAPHGPDTRTATLHRLRHSRLAPFDPSTTPWDLINTPAGVYRALQKPNTFVILGEGATFLNISTGLSIAEDSRVATADWVGLGRELYDVRATARESLAVPVEAMLIEFARQRVAAPGFNRLSATSVALAEHVERLVSDDEEWRATLAARQDASLRILSFADASPGALAEMNPIGAVCRVCQRRAYLSTAFCGGCGRSVCLACFVECEEKVCLQSGLGHGVEVVRRFVAGEMKALLEKFGGGPSRPVTEEVKSGGGYDPFA